MPPLQAALDRGLAYVRSVQKEDGSFESYSSSAKHPFTAERTYHTTFTPALILGALSGIEKSLAIRNPLAAWLVAQRSKVWSFNYWAKGAVERRTLLYPDDLDDTFCALSSLYQHDPRLVDAAALGVIVKLLLATEAQPGGPYHTWLVTRDAPEQWRDIDLAVNSNVAYFLNLVAKPLPNVTALMEQAMMQGTFTSPYYPSAMPILYFVARAYQGDKKHLLVDHLKTQPLATPLDAALGITAFLRLDEHTSLEPLLHTLLQNQHANGSWAAEAFCADPGQAGQPYYHGAAALTTAFALEALQLYATNLRAGQLAKPKQRATAYQSIITEAKRQFAPVGTDLQGQLSTMIDYMAKGDTSQEIVLLPQLFAASLRTRPKISLVLLRRLSLANLYGWLAYTIYDDFLDGEGNPSLLSVANVAMRASITAFSTAMPDEHFQRHLYRTFDIIDSANAWEVAHCRAKVNGGRIVITTLPRYADLGRLAERSWGHTLAPLAVLLTAGHPLGGREARIIELALRHYLISRQLLDDLHDWENDFQSGRLTAVVTEILRNMHLKSGEHDISTLLPRMQRKFWTEILPIVCTRIERHLSAGTQALEDSQLLKKGPFYKLFTRLETTMQETRQEQSKANSFLAAYKKPLVERDSL